MVYALDGRGGGNALPPYLQGRSPLPATQPMITPKATVMPGEVARPFGTFPNRSNLANMAGQINRRARSAITPQDAFRRMQGKLTPPNWTPITPKQRGLEGNAGPTANTPQTLYDFFKRDLEDQRRSALADTTSNAASRGVYYGTPLTTSQGDIQTQYLRGLGSLQAGVLQNEQQNELSRLGIAGNLLNSAQQAPGGQIDPAVYQMLGTLFGNSAVGGQRSGPMITPKMGNNPPELPYENNRARPPR